MPHSYPFIPAEFVHGIESLSPRCMRWALSLALLRFELGQGWEAAMLGGTYDCASSETGPPISLQLFSSFGFAWENDHPLTSTACTSSADSRCDWAEGLPDWLNLGRGMEGGGLYHLSLIWWDWLIMQWSTKQATGQKGFGTFQVYEISSFFVAPGFKPGQG